MTIVFLVRHGENEYTKTGRLAGRIDGVSLNDAGREQATRVAERFADAPLAAIYSSPVLRCLETAQPLAEAKQLVVQPLDGVAEVDFGTWQGQALKDLQKDKLWTVVQHHPSAMTFPGGETMRCAQARAVDAIEAVAAAHPEAAIAVFAHSDIIKMIVAHYLGTPLDLFQRIAISTASVSAIMVDPGGGMPMVLGVNSNSGQIKLPPAQKPKNENENAAADDEPPAGDKHEAHNPA